MVSKKSNTILENNINHSDIFNKNEWNPVGTKNEHKRSFPLKMIEDLIKCFPNSNVILDPYMGSGTTAIACINQNRNFIGIELNKEYVLLSKKSIEKAIKEKRLEDEQKLPFD